MELLLCKQDLEKYSGKDLALLAKHRGVNADNKNDLCWLLSLDLIAKKRGTMITSPESRVGKRVRTPSLRQSLFKPVRATTSGFADKYNLDDSECKWPARIGGFLVKDCQLPIVPLETVTIDKDDGGDEYDIVTVPVGSSLYHGTKDPARKHESVDSWSKQPVTWFATTLDHTMPLGPMKIHEFTTKEPLTLLFVRNMTKKYNISSGAVFIPMLISIGQQISEETKERIYIDGYVGCNECEIGILRKSLDKLNYPSTIKNAPYIE